MDNNSLSHTKWECKYHIVFAPKFRRKIIYNQIRADNEYDQMPLNEYIDPFTGEQVRKSK